MCMQTQQRGLRALHGGRRFTRVVPSVLAVEARRGALLARVERDHADKIAGDACRMREDVHKTNKCL